MPFNYGYRFIEFPPHITHQGTGPNVQYKPWLVDPSSVSDVSRPLTFKGDERYIVVMCLAVLTQSAPNWYGIAFRPTIRSFTSVNIFFHPHPTDGMQDDEYLTKTGDWRSLFRYAQNLGFQFDAGNCDQILIIPFFSNATWNNGGIFFPNWREVVFVILNSVKSVASMPELTKMSSVDIIKVAEATVDKLQRNSNPKVNVPGAIDVQDVVLSCFSAGRVPMVVALNSTKMQDLKTSFLREIWDFDGSGTSRPTSNRSLKVIAYDQQQTNNGSSSFHVPVQRWSGFPDFRPTNSAQVHGLIPDRLLWHATTVSQVGK